jgi:hypothetical protein
MQTCEAMKRVIVTSLTAPHGTIYESLRIEHERRIVGNVVEGPCALGYYRVKFPTVEDGQSMDIHRSMIAPAR